MKKFKENLIVIGLYFIITCIFTFPLISQPASYAVWDDVDTYLMQWTLAQDVHKLETNPLDLFNANYFYPHQNTLAYSEHHLGSSLLAYPIIKISNSPLLALNFLILISYVLSAWGTYLLVFRLTNNRPAAFISGLIFAFAPFRAIHFTRLHVVSTQYLPFIFFYLEKTLRNPKFRNFFLFTIFILFQSLTSLHLTIFTAGAVIIYLIVSFLIKHFSFKIALLYIASLAAVFLINLPLLMPYFQLKNVAGSNLYIANYYSPTIIDKLRVSPIFNGIFDFPETFERISYTGFVILFLLVVSFYVIFETRQNFSDKNKKVITAYLVILVLFFLLSFGPFIRFNSQDEGIAGPYSLAMKLIPGEMIIRTPGRFMIIGFFVAAVLVGLGFANLLRRLSSDEKRKVLIGGVVFLILSEFYFMPPFSPLRLSLKIENRDIGPVYQWIFRQSGDYSILELPMSKNILIESRHMYYSINHWKPLINGHNGLYPKEYFDLEDTVKRFPAPDSLEIIRSYHVKYVIVHFDEMELPFQHSFFQGIINSADLNLVFNSGSIHIYELEEPAG